MLAKPALTEWKVKQAILATLTLPKDATWLEGEYIDRIRRDANQQALDAANKGTSIHNAIEAHFQGRKYANEYRPHVDGVVAALAKAFPQVGDWIAEKSFAHPIGFGGRVDLHSPSARIVVDHKGKDFGPNDDTRLVYDQHEQLAACAEGLFRCQDDGPAPVLVSCFFSRTHAGHTALHIWDPDAFAKGWRVFRAALDIWKARNNYECGW